MYRHYENREALFDGLQDWVTKEIKARRGTETLSSVDQLTAAAQHAFGVIDDLGPAYRAAQLTAAGRRAHDRNNRVDRKNEITSALRSTSARLDADSAQRLRAVVHALASSESLHLMRDVWGLTTSDVSETIAWAIRTLTEAAPRDARAGAVIGQPAAGAERRKS